MLDGRRVLWSMNLFDKVDHLRQQQFLVRRAFGDRVEILTFCNDVRTDARYLEDHYEQFPVNSGHHNGVRDAVNFSVEAARRIGCDTLVVSHADCLLTDYSVVPEMLHDMDSRGAAVGWLHSLTNRDVHSGNAVRPYISNDLFVLSSRAFTLFPFDDDCQSTSGVEVMLAEHLMRSLSPEHVYVIPSGPRTPDPDRFVDFVRPGVELLCTNDISLKNARLREVNPDAYVLLRENGILTIDG